jgi:limonene-1,2-epoxide hydrolase
MSSAPGAAASSATQTSTPETTELDAAELQAALARLKVFFETLGPASVARLDEIYSAQAYFKDPFNEVRGLAEVQRIFRHMFVQVKDPRFVVHAMVAQGSQAFITWDFVFELHRFQRGAQVVRGASHLQFDDAGKVSYHRDYWDLAEELYEKLPVLGGLMRWLKARAAQ